MANDAFKALDGFAERLERAPVPALEAARIAINEGAEYAEARGRVRVLEELNLEGSYVRRNLYLNSRATTGTIEARIRANNRGSLATRYGAKQRTEAAKSPLRRLKGDAARGIPRGRKAAGSTAWSVLRGGAKIAWRNAFFVNLKGSGAWALVARYGSGAGYRGDKKGDWDDNLEVVHGYSIGQFWRRHRAEVGRQSMVIANQRFIEEFEKRV